MRNQIVKYLLILLIIIFSIILSALIYIKFFSINKSEDYAILREKGEGEIIYLDSTIIELLNKLNNISYSRYQVTIEQINENQQQSNSQSNSEGSSGSENSSGNEDKSASSDTDSAAEATNESENRTSRLTKTNSLLMSDYNNISWNEISYGIESLYTAWPTISLDMKALNVKDEDISNFSVTLDGVAQAVKNNDKNNCLINLYNLYTMLPRFLSYFLFDDTKINIYNTKAYVLNAYISASNDNWQEMNTSIEQAINSFSGVMNSKNIEDTETSTLDKTNSLLQELKRGVNLQDKEIFYLKYKLTIEQLEIL